MSIWNIKQKNIDIFVYFAYCTQYVFCGIIYGGGDYVGKTSSKVKDRYNQKVYDEIKIRVKKGMKDQIMAHADLQGESTNAFINRAIDETMQRDNEKSGDQ